METFKAINQRKSIRGYTDMQINDNDLKKILDVANKAPNAGPFHITVVQNPEFLREINDRTKENMLASKGFLKERASIPGYEPLYGAPTFIILSAPEIPFNQINIACAITTMAIAATDLGIGSCYVISPIQTLIEEYYMDRLELPEGYVPISGLLLGYESEKCIPGTLREEKNNINYIKQL